MSILGNYPSTFWMCTILNSGTSGERQNCSQGNHFQNISNNASVFFFSIENHVMVNQQKHLVSKYIYIIIYVRILLIYIFKSQHFYSFMAFCNKKHRSTLTINVEFKSVWLWVRMTEISGTLCVHLKCTTAPFSAQGVSHWQNQLWQCKYMETQNSPCGKQ